MSMSQEGSIEEKRPNVSLSVLSQSIESGSYDSYNTCVEGESSVDEKIIVPVGDEVRDSGHRFARDSDQMIQRKNENMTENNGIRDKFQMSVESQSEGQCGDMTHLQLGDSFDGATCNIERDRRFAKQKISNSDDAILEDPRRNTGTDGVSSDIFQKESRRQVLENENFRLRQNIKGTSSELILDENGRPMQLKEDILLRQENERLSNKIAVLESRLDEAQHMLPRIDVQHNPSPETSVVVAPSIDGMIYKIERLEASNHEYLMEKNKLEREVREMYRTMNEMFEASENELQKLLKAEKDKNKALVEECKHLRHQESRRQVLENENFRLRQNIKDTSSELILDENGRPMQLKEDILLRQENERLSNKIAVLESRLDEAQHMLPRIDVQHNPSPETSVVVAPSIDGMIYKIERLEASNHEYLMEKNKFEREAREMHRTMNEMFEASENGLQKLLKAEKDKNKALVEECKHLRHQVETFRGDYEAEKGEWRKKESQWDHKFTRERALNEKLKREVKEEKMEVMRLQAQYQKEFQSKMKIQEDFEKRKHEPSKATTSIPGPYPSSQRSMMSDASFELIQCEVCSLTFVSMSKLDNHLETCHRRNPVGCQTQE
ncbi:DNA ligase 1-like isoform X2 [Lineus longissimus]|uniref:DNA ligase 1-like isoform X2 n=1 Tax=Lineus longissimus TaxID=88925 RepID=UPI00315C7E73